MTDLLRSNNPGVDLEQALAPMTPLGRLGQPADIADVVAFLASPDARWITGQNLRASGGSPLTNQSCTHDRGGPAARQNKGRHGRREGKRKLRGRQPKLIPKQQSELRRMDASGDYSITDLTEVLSVSRSTVYRSLQRSSTSPS